ncbi:radical SAM peptide maturase, CXXX-repeat target family, partial [Myxococcota bacterium]|nr:radical SAM peptide maturase, CXXX-repeat target family [Myxococcota bacterium]
MSLNIRYENRPLPYAQGLSSSITFILTDDCQLRCRYCYLHHKSRSHIMPFHVARTTVDYVLSHRDLWPSPAVIFDFMGGEPFLEISLMDRICDYIKKSMYVADHPWFDDYLISCSTNGLLYKSDRVQRFIAKNHEHLDISISLDGTREKHDCNRVFPDGSGSYDRVRENFSLYLEQFPRGTTKATISSADIPHVARSVLHLFSLGVGFVDINVVFEDVWRPGDSEAFEAQLLLLADTMISQRLYEQHSCSFFSADLGRPMDPVYENTNWCGTGRMLAVDQDGVFYPCNRFTQNALTCGKPRAIGDIRGGI